MEIERESQKARELAEREARKERLRLAEERLRAEGESFPPLQRMPSILDAYETPNWPPMKHQRARTGNTDNGEREKEEEPMSVDSDKSTKNSSSSESSPAKEKMEECENRSEDKPLKKLPLLQAKQQTSATPTPPTNYRPPPNACKSNNNSTRGSPQPQQQQSQWPSANKPDLPSRDEKALNDLLQNKVNTLEYLLFQKNNTIELHVVNTSRLASLCEQQRTTLDHVQESYARLQEVLRSVEAQLASQERKVSELETERDNSLNEFLASDREIERKIEQLETTISDQQTQIDSLTRQQQQLQLLSEQPPPPAPQEKASHPTLLQKAWPNVLESVCLGRNLPPPKYLYRRHVHTGMYLVTTEVNGLGTLLD